MFFGFKRFVDTERNWEDLNFYKVKRDRVT